jgi:hypothetical protein
MGKTFRLSIKTFLFFSGERQNKKIMQNRGIKMETRTVRRNARKSKRKKGRKIVYVKYASRFVAVTSHPPKAHEVTLQSVSPTLLLFKLSRKKLIITLRPLKQMLTYWKQRYCRIANINLHYCACVGRFSKVTGWKTGVRFLARTRLMFSSRYRLAQIPNHFFCLRGTGYLSLGQTCILNFNSIW